MNETMLFFFFILIGAGVLYGIFLHKKAGKALARKFVSLGDLRDLTKSEIIDVVGPPHSFSAIGGGKSLLQWIVPGYHIAMIFNGKWCEGVQHEFSADL
jgi:hypothetical protein